MPAEGSGVGLHQPGTPGYRRLNLAMVLAGLAAFGLLYAPQPVLPQIGADLGVGASATSLTVSATTGALALSVLPAAGWATRWGRLRVIRVGLVVSVVLTLATTVAPGLAGLVALRALAGVSLAAVVAVAMGHVGAEVDPRGLGSAMGLYVAGNTLGGVAGRLVTSGVSDLAGWRWGVGALALLAGLVTVAFWRLAPAPRAGPGPGQGAAGTPSSPSSIGGSGVRRPVVLVLLLVPFTLMGGFVAVYNYLGYRLSAAPFDLAPAVLGLVFLAYLAGTASSAVAGRAVDRVGPPRVLAVSVVLMLAGLLVTLAGSLASVVVGLVVLTAGFFGAHATASGWMPGVAAPDGPRGSALYVGAYYAGSAVFGLAVGPVWVAAGWPGVVAAVGALTVVGLTAGLAVDRLDAGRSRRAADLSEGSGTLT